MAFPRKSRLHAVILCSLAFVGAAVSAAIAQWPSDPMVNLAIADRNGEQVLPKIASTPDRGCYVGWFDQSGGSYAVYLQRLDAAGNEQWPHNGVLVSNHPQSTSLVEWDLTSDSAGNCVLVFTDTRAGSDLDIYAYKIDPQGQMLWGADGLTLSDNTDFEPSPRVCEASDGDLVFVWGRYPSTGDAALMMQRVSPAGVERFTHGGLAVVSTPNEDPGFASVIPSVNGTVIALWVRDISTFSSPRHLLANRFGTDGAALWGANRFVYDFTPVPIAYWPVIQPDGVGGALVLWHRSASNLFNCLIQHLDADGNEAFPHNGVVVSTNTGRHHLDPTLSYRRATGEIFVFWNERNLNQSQWGVYGQKFSSAGVRQWGDDGLVLLPVDTVYKLFVRSAPYADGAMVFLLDEPSGGGQQRVIGMRVDNAGIKVWPGPYIGVSTRLSSKGRLPITQDAGGAVKLVWEDNRNGTVDVYGQNVNPNGTLGPEPAAIDGPEDHGSSAEAPAVSCSPNPFRGSTEFSYPAPVDPSRAYLSIMDPAGRLVRRLSLNGSGAGDHRVRWDGKDSEGRSAPAGVYYYSLGRPGDPVISGASAARSRSGQLVILR